MLRERGAGSQEASLSSQLFGLPLEGSWRALSWAPGGQQGEWGTGEKTRLGVVQADAPRHRLGAEGQSHLCACLRVLSASAQQTATPPWTGGERRARRQ